MTDHDDNNNEIIEIDFEVRHVSILRSEPTVHNPPRTHDWKVFLRSADINGDLSRLIQRCIFHLHPEYSNHKRELKTSPYAIQETGYAGFKLPIDIYFQTKKEPRKFRIDYDLDLHRNIDGHPFRQKESYLKKYRCTFYNPDSEFREKILAAGGRIVESGPAQSTSATVDENDFDNEPITRQSPQQKRPASPVSTSNGTGNKKLKVESTTTNIKKKSVQPVTNKTITNTKKSKLVSHKSSSLLDEKVSKMSTNQTSNNNNNTSTENLENSSINKPRPTATKLIKSQSTTNINPSTLTSVKKKEPIPSPTKSKTSTNPQTITKKPVNKTSLKTSTKSDLTSNSVVKSPLNIKQESSSHPTSTTNNNNNNSTSSMAISNLKKIPKKTVVPKTEEKRSQSLKPTTVSSSSTRNSLPISKKPSQKSTKEPTKPKTSLKREHSVSSINTMNSNNSDRPKKIKTNPTSSRNESIKSTVLPSSASASPPKSARTSPQSQIDSVINSTVSSPSVTQLPSNETNHIETPVDTFEDTYDEQIQLSEKSDSPAEQIPIEPMKISSSRLSCSDESETNDSDLCFENDLTIEQDLPTILTNDDLRFKLIFIYKRFQLNSFNDLTTFVQFFKRHQLIDTNRLSSTKSTNEMITYDLFLLSPSQIIELANDLGYTTTNIINSIA